LASGDPILVTGATGFVGSAVLRKLVEGGERVRVLARAGGDPWALPIAPDEIGRLREIIEEGLTADLLLLSGGVSMRSLAPGFTFGFWRGIEAMLDPFRDQLAMFVQITLRRREDS